MSKQTKPGVSGKSQLVRPRFSPGMLLQDDDLSSVVDYSSELSRLICRSLFGCGVVCGLKVTLHKREGCTPAIHVEPGLALNRYGDPVHLTALQKIPVQQDSGKLWVVISRTVIHCQRREVACPVDDDASESVTTRMHDGFQIVLCGDADALQGACGCEPLANGELAGDPATRHAKCYRKHANGLCDCAGESDLVVLGLFSDLAAALTNAASLPGGLSADHSARRFISPAFLTDPLLPGAASLPTPRQTLVAAATNAEDAKAAANAVSATAARNRDRLVAAQAALANLTGDEADRAKATLQEAIDDAQAAAQQEQAAVDTIAATAAKLRGLIAEP